MSDDDDSMAGSASSESDTEQEQEQEQEEEEPEWLRGAHARLEALYAADPRLHMGAKMAPAWQFLYDRFNALMGCLRIADPERQDTHAVRIGREPHDRWLDVQFDAPLASDSTPFPDSDDDDDERSKASRYQVIREALVLTSVVARCDYTTWIEELGRACQFSVPHHIHVDLAPLARTFSFTFAGLDDPSDYAWAELQHLFGDETSKDFVREYRKAVRVAASHGIDLRTMAPIPIHLRFYSNPAWSDDQEIQMLQGIVETIDSIKKLESSYRHVQHAPTSTRDLMPPVFTVASIGLEMEDLLFSPAVLQALQRVLETGVTVASLTLPMFPLSEAPHDLPRCLAAWSQLAATICGLRPRHSVHVATVLRVALTAPTVHSPYWAPFLSALRHSRGLVSIVIALGRDDAVGAEHLLWPWLAFSLFNARATSSVEALHLDTVAMPSELDSFAAIMASTDPLGELWHATKATCAEAPTVTTSARNKTTSVVIREGAIFALRGDGAAGVEIRVPRECDGELVHDDLATTSVGVLLPGYGLGVVDRECVTTIVEVQEDRTHVPRRRLLRTLVLDTPTVMVASDDMAQQEQRRVVTRSRLQGFVQLIGATLTSLAISADGLDTASVEAILRACPMLESVRLSAMPLQSLQFLAHYYASGGCRISSLELRSGDIEPADVEALLRLLVVPADGGAVKHTLKKLRLDEMWNHDLPDTTVRALLAVAEDATSLDHLHVNVNSFEQLRALSPARVARHHGESVPPTPLALAKRLALVSALRAFPEESAVMQLGTDMLRLVFQFAAQPMRRVVLFDCHDY